MIDYAGMAAWAAEIAPFVIDTLVFTSRTAAGTLAILCAITWWRTRQGHEHPPYNRRLNEIAWNWAYSGCLIGALAFIALDIEYRNVTGEGVADLFVALVWWCWANAVTVRLASRVQRPRFVYLGVSIFMVVMPIYTIATAG